MNEIKVLRIKAENIRFFEDDIFDIDLVNRLQVSNYDKDHSYYNLNSSVYLPKTVVIQGVNSSGKTTILELIDLAMQIFFNLKELNSPEISQILDKFFIGGKIKLTMFYSYGDSQIIKISSSIAINTDYSTRKNYNYMFTNEEISIKNLTSTTRKYSLYESGYKIIELRSELSKDAKTFLSVDRSMNFMQIRYHAPELSKMITYSKDSRFIDNFKLDLDGLDNTIIRFLDPSIKTIQQNQPIFMISDGNSIKNPTYDVTFTSGDVVEMTPLQIREILSTGTFRGIELMKKVKRVLKTGGYLIVDELELHLNKSIIVDIVRLFKYNDTNPNNATLIFTTHYTEVIDTFDRNDQIYISHRNEKYEMMLSNYSDYEKKHELRKSDYYFADTHSLGTAISYDVYNDLRKSFKEQHDD